MHFPVSKLEKIDPQIPLTIDRIVPVTDARNIKVEGNLSPLSVTRKLAQKTPVCIRLHLLLPYKTRYWRARITVSESGSVKVFQMKA